jgi:hypothetical protein
MGAASLLTLAWSVPFLLSYRLDNYEQEVKTAIMLDFFLNTTLIFCLEYSIEFFFHLHKVVTPK